MGLPGGGIISVGKTHALVRAGDVAEPTALLLGPRVLDNAGLYLGQGIDAKRVILPTAERVVIGGTELPMDAKAMARALQGIPVSVGDTVGVDPAYAEGAEDHIEVEVIAVTPGQAVMVGAHTRIVPESESGEQARVPMSTPDTRTEAVESQVPSTAEALVAGLTNELDVLTGWFSLLTSHRDLPAAWGLPEVAGVIVEGPTGCGKVELVHAAAEAAGANVHEVNVDLVFKPQKLLDLLEKAVKTSPVPGVVMINRLEAVTGEEGLSAFKTQVGAILRWFLDAVSERRGLAAVLGVSSLRHLDDTVVKSPLLPRTLSIPPPDLDRREALFEAALAKVPTDGVDYAQLAARTAGFSGADILAAVVHASAMVARTANDVTTDLMFAAIEETTPSLGTVSMGEIPSYGFERVAGLENVKQRLTEAVRAARHRQDVRNPGARPRVGGRLLPDQGSRTAGQVRRRVGARCARGVLAGPGGGPVDSVLRRDRRAGAGARIIINLCDRLGGRCHAHRDGRRRRSRRHRRHRRHQPA
jgi:ATP-dependent 26S proteasome regulatory subunit